MANCGASLDGMNLRAALSETMSHLEHLASVERISWVRASDLGSQARVINVMELRN